jgi:hypothetical protein
MTVDTRRNSIPRKVQQWQWIRFSLQDIRINIFAPEEIPKAQEFPQCQGDLFKFPRGFL